MLSKWFKTEKPRICMGSVVVAPRSELKKIDEWGMFYREDFEDAIRVKLQEIFNLPHVSTVVEPKPNDLALEVVVVKIQGGEFGIAQGDLIIPFFWRPKVMIKSRLYYVATRKTKVSFTVYEKMPWGQYLSRVFSLRGVIRFKPLFDLKDMETLLYKGCINLLSQIGKKNDL